MYLTFQTPEGSQRCVEQVTDRWSHAGQLCDQLALYWREATLSLFWATKSIPPPFRPCPAHPWSHPGTAAVQPPVPQSPAHASSTRASFGVEY